MFFGMIILLYFVQNISELKVQIKFCKQDVKTVVAWTEMASRDEEKWMHPIFGWMIFIISIITL